MPIYERRQVGKSLIYVALAQGAIGMALLSVNTVVGVSLVVLAGLTAWLFTTLTVSVTDADVAWYFGPGLVRRRVALAEIRAVRVVRLPWYSGIGIHLTANGWLYNVASGPVVQIEQRDGSRLNLGSPEPDVLATAILAEQRAAPAVPDDPLPHAHGIPLPLLSAFLVGLIGLAAAAFVVWHGEQPVDIAIADGQLAVRGAGYSASVPTAAIVTVTLADSMPAIDRRTGGFAAGGFLRGAFEVKDLGRAEVFVNAHETPFVIVRTPRTVLILNASTPDATRALYNALRTLSGGK